MARLQALCLAPRALVGGRGSAPPTIDTLATLEVSAAASAGGSAALRAHVRIGSAFLGVHVSDPLILALGSR